MLNGWMEREGLNIWWQCKEQKYGYYVMRLYKVKKKKKKNSRKLLYIGIKHYKW